MFFRVWISKLRRKKKSVILFLFFFFVFFFHILPKWRKTNQWWFFLLFIHSYDVHDSFFLLFFFWSLFTFRLIDEQCSSGSESFRFCSHLLLFIHLYLSLSLSPIYSCITHMPVRVGINWPSLVVSWWLCFFFYNKTRIVRHKIMHIINKKNY